MNLSCTTQTLETAAPFKGCWALLGGDSGHSWSTAVASWTEKPPLLVSAPTTIHSPRIQYLAEQRVQVLCRFTGMAILWGWLLSLMFC